VPSSKANFAGRWFMLGFAAPPGSFAIASFRRRHPANKVQRFAGRQLDYGVKVSCREVWIAGLHQAWVMSGRPTSRYLYLAVGHRLVCLRACKTGQPGLEGSCPGEHEPSFFARSAAGVPSGEAEDGQCARREIRSLVLGISQNPRDRRCVDAIRRAAERRTLWRSPVADRTDGRTIQCRRVGRASSPTIRLSMTLKRDVVQAAQPRNEECRLGSSAIAVSDCGRRTKRKVCSVNVHDAKRS
jgi:hypothetical protein